jgi:hypothetical protein
MLSPLAGVFIKKIPRLLLRNIVRTRLNKRAFLGPNSSVFSDI